ncbi:hypothetical protein BUALT_Bualt11G0038500 [Buddleja alternifolia]|uniref:Peptidase S8/S53 domain-containing protein n=1 Tax=Buddleja alternifolia TaxID=168488 RepID=A0AAV6WT45_9LAMI|nr:hypothetical protein BUALT_Bualt11G0038500 [Buddleja alternifolia]
MPPVPARWKGKCQPGEAFNFSTCNRKVVGARYYLNGYEAEEELEKTVSFRSARDSAGHGSHTASTASGRYVNNMNYKGLASGGARGGAPMTRIAVYKTCWSSACYDVDLLAAFDDAIRDGVHVYITLFGRGIVVIASVGNEGNPGSATNIAPWIVTVGASSTDRDFTSDIILGNGAHFSGESLSLQKMNTSARIISASEAYAGYFTPYQSRNPTSKILSAKTVLGSQAAPRVAPFSSKGPNALTPEILKPDVLAPGLNILAAWSPATANMNFNILSGTSMACPHVTGIVALIKAVHASWSPSAIKSAIMTTATMLDKHRKPIRAGPDGRKANPFDMGSGFVNPKQVLDPGLIYDATASDYNLFFVRLVIARDH